MHATNLRSLKSAGGFFPSAPLALLVPSVLRAAVSPSECPLRSRSMGLSRPILRIVTRSRKRGQEASPGLRRPSLLRSARVTGCALPTATTEAISSPQMRFLVCAQDDWDDWDEEAEDIDDLVLEFGRCINTLRVEFGPKAARPGAKATAARQHLGISARPVWSTHFAILPGRSNAANVGVPGGAAASSLAPLAPDDDIITHWLLEKTRDLQAARSSGMGAAKAAAPARS